MDPLPYDAARLRALAGEIVGATRELAAAGMTPATSSNFSMRLDERHAAITVSGRDKGRLSDDDIMVVDFDGRAVGSDHRPSAETRLHTQLYARFPEIGSVLHTHSVVQTVASRVHAAAGHGDGRVPVVQAHREVAAGGGCHARGGELAGRGDDFAGQHA